MLIYCIIHVLSGEHVSDSPNIRNAQYSDVDNTKKIEIESERYYASDELESSKRFCAFFEQKNAPES